MFNQPAQERVHVTGGGVHRADGGVAHAVVVPAAEPAAHVAAAARVAAAELQLGRLARRLARHGAQGGAIRAQGRHDVATSGAAVAHAHHTARVAH